MRLKKTYRKDRINMTEEQLKFVEPILNTFENEDIRSFAVEILNELPSV